MNNTFNINRFGKLLAFDGRKYIRNFGITLAILCGLNLVLWLLTLIFGFTMPTLPRYLVIYLAVFLGILLVPSKAFGDINLSREGIRYAMLPVSNLEKFLSYTLFCLLTPVVIIFGSWALDSLLTLLPFGGFTHYIKSFRLSGALQNFFMEIGELSEIEMTDEGFVVYQQFMDKFGPAYNLQLIISLIFSVGIFMLGNLLFKTHKAGKTLACMIGITYVISMFMQLFLIHKGFPWMSGQPLGDAPSFDTLADFATSTLTYNNIVHTILLIGLYIGIFLKLKTQKY